MSLHLGVNQVTQCLKVFKVKIQDSDWSQESQLIWSGVQSFTSVYHTRDYRNQEIKVASPKAVLSRRKVNTKCLVASISVLPGTAASTNMFILTPSKGLQQGQPHSGEMTGACSQGSVIPLPKRAFEPHKMGFSFYSAIILISVSTEIIW